MKILVTGGAGYIGSTLVPMLLAKGHQVCVLDSLLHGGQGLLGPWSHPAFTFVKGDVRDPQAVERAMEGAEAVVHLAAIVGDPACARDTQAATDVNLRASTALFTRASRLGVKRFVFASTCSNYGRMADPTAYVTETSDLNPVSHYAETKVGVERLVLAGDAGGRMNSTVLRFATVFGVSPRMRFDLTVNEFTMEMLTKQHLVVFGEQFWRPYIHVRDAARAIVAVLEADSPTVGGEVFNAGSTDQNYQKVQLVDMIRPLAPGARVEFVHRDEDPRDYRVSFSKIKQVLGFEVSRTVTQGILEVAGLVASAVIDDFASPRYRN